MPAPGHRTRRRATTFVFALVAVGAGCPTPSDNPGKTKSPGVGPPGSRDDDGGGLSGPRVGNQAKGIDAMPDFDASARELREEMVSRLPDPLPAPAAACKAMLDAAVEFYRATEGEESTSLRAMQRARPGDETVCRTETSPAAAACVTILLRAHAGEYPWLVDQCSRAFPPSS